MQYWSNMSPLNSRNIVDPTQLIGYNPDQRVQKNNNYYFFLLEVFSLCKIVIFCSWHASVTVFTLCGFLHFLGWKWNVWEIVASCLFLLPPVALVSPFACCSRVTSRDSPQWRACPQANLGSIIKAVEEFKPGEFLFLAIASCKDRGSSFFLKESKIQKIHWTLQPFFYRCKQKIILSHSLLS